MAKLQPMMKLTNIEVKNNRVVGTDKDGTSWTQFLRFPKTKGIKCTICREPMVEGNTYWQDSARNCVCDHHVSF